MSNKTSHESHPTKSSMLLPGFPSRRSGSLGGNLTGAGLIRLSRLITSQGVQRSGGRGNREQSEPPKTLPPHHLAGRAEMKRESQPRQSEKHDSAAKKQLLDPQPTNEPRRQKRARVHRTSDQRFLHPSRWTKFEWEERKTLGKQHKGIPRPPTPSSRPSEGREGEEREAPGCVTSEEVPARGKDIGAGEERA